MPRPRKWRKVCCLPDSNRFGPLDSPADAVNTVNMTVDEYETIRLIDLDRFTQEECANQMNISRTTVQGIYDEARNISSVTAAGTAVAEAAVGVIDAAEVLRKSPKLKII